MLWPTKRAERLAQVALTYNRKNEKWEMGKEPFMGRICKAFGISCDADRDFRLSFFILENDEIDVLLFSISTVCSDFVTQLYRGNKLAYLIP